MTRIPRVISWDEISEGMQAESRFRVEESDMDAFAQISGDTSRIHVDAEFARRNGFEDRVVYGAFVVAKLSEFVGMLLPGDLGLATSWQIDFRQPVYVGDECTMRGEVSHKSDATHTVKIKFKVTARDQIVSSGSASSRILQT